MPDPSDMRESVGFDSVYFMDVVREYRKPSWTDAHRVEFMNLIRSMCIIDYTASQRRMKLKPDQLEILISERAKLLATRITYSLKNARKSADSRFA